MTSAGSSGRPATDRGQQPSSCATVVFVIAGLAGGGAERVLSTLANETSALGHVTSVITLDAEEVDFYPLGEAVERVRVSIALETSASHGRLLRRLRAELSLLRELRRLLRERAPDAVISFSSETNSRVLLATLFSGLRVIVAERSDPAQNPLGPVWKLCRRLLYPHAAVVVLQTEDARAWVESHLAVRRTAVVPNPVTPYREAPGVLKPSERPVIAAMGRLRPEKGFDLLLQAFAMARSTCPDWQLVIIGDGPERLALEAQRTRLQLHEHVTFLGMLADPLPTLRQADLFVLPSRFEGFPNALLEAMACGLPVVSFDCPSGPRAIIRAGEDGVLVPPGDVGALADAMTSLMQHPSERARLGAAALAVRDRFSTQPIVLRWLELARAVPERGNERVPASTHVRVSAG